MSARWKAPFFGLVATLALPVCGQVASSQAFTDTGLYGNVGGLNASGDIFAGADLSFSVNPRAYRWSWLSNARVDLGTLGGDAAWAFDINAAGDIVVGASRIGPGSTQHAYRWSAATGTMTDLGTLGGDYSSANGVNAAGDVVVGGASTTTAFGNWVHAFRWSAATGTMVDLGTLGGASSNAQDVSAAGDVVVGNAYLADGTSNHAFRWTLASGTMSDLGTLGGTYSSANATNAAGDVVVGFSHIAGDVSTHAFRWTVATGTMTDLGTLGGTTAIAFDVNAAGNVVVGYSSLAGDSSQQGFRWTSDGGMQSIESWLAANGVSIGSMRTLSASATNAEGNIITGALDNNHIYMARVISASATGGSGLIDVQEFNAGLARVSNSGLLAANDAETAMNGLHSNPMRTLLPRGRSSFWVAGDAGRQLHEPYSSTLGIAEIGYGYRPSQDWQVNLSAGRSVSQADTGLGGRTSARSNYLAPEVIISLPASSYLTLTGYYGQGRADIDRVYLNAGTPQSAFGNPGQSTVGARLRWDWRNAARLGQMQLTPYASLTWLRTRTQGYREQGGAFPVDWQARVDRATTARLGLDALYPLTEATTLQWRTEAAHRFEQAGAATSGQVLGLYGFNFAGQEIKQDWLRLGLGLESRLGDGVASLMLNATSQGQAPSYWMSAAYRWEF